MEKRCTMIRRSTAKTLAQKSLDERWLPIKRNIEKGNIYSPEKVSDCPFCGRKGCRSCPVYDNSDVSCCEEWQSFSFLCMTDDIQLVILALDRLIALMTHIAKTGRRPSK